MLEPSINNVPPAIQHRALSSSWGALLQSEDAIDLMWVEAIANLCQYQQNTKCPAAETLSSSQVSGVNR